MAPHDHSTDSQDDYFWQLPEGVANMQNPPINNPTRPKRNKESCLNNLRYDQALQPDFGAPLSVAQKAVTPKKEHESFDDSYHHSPKQWGIILYTILGIGIGIGIFATSQYFGLLSGTVSDSRILRIVEKRKANLPDAKMSTGDSLQDRKGTLASSQLPANAGAVSEKQVSETRPFLVSDTPGIDKIPARMLRLDDEFSRLKIEISDWQKADAYRKSSLVRNSQLTKFILTGKLMIRTSSDERNAANLPLVYVPAGQFLMGQTVAQRVESARATTAAHFDFSHPAHPVQVVSGFFIGTYEITVGQLQEFAAQNAALGTATVSLGIENERNLNKPAHNVDWNTAMAFCKWLSQINNFAVRLPTEVEWEFAARGNMWIQIGEAFREKDLVMGGPWPVDNPTLDRSWCGCVGMNSNLQEWTIDPWDEKLYQVREIALKSRGNASFLYQGLEPNAINPPNESRAVRGSSYQDIPANRNLAIRRYKPVNAREETLGFRVVVPVLHDEKTGK